MAISWRHQDLIEAPLEDVWELVTDPARYPEWAERTIDVTGVPRHIEKGSTFRQTTNSPLGPVTTTFLVEEMDDDLRELKLRCIDTGYYSHWLLTEARGSTFADVEMGLEPQGQWGEQAADVVTKGYLRGMAEQVLDGIRKVLGRRKAHR